MEKKTNRNLGLKFILIIETCTLLVYTGITMKNDGVDVFGEMVRNISALDWDGQFTLDFLCYLVLSGLWIMWRDKFSLGAVVFGIVASILGIIVFAPFVLYLLIKEKGDLKKLLLGQQLS